MTPITILHVTSPAPRPIWEELYKADPEAVPYQSPAWLDCACLTSNLEDASRYYELSNGHRFVMPIVRSRKLPPALALAGSMPHGWGMGGLISETPPSREEVRVLLADLSRLPYLHLNIRPNPRLGPAWQDAIPPRIQRVPRQAHVIDLEGGFDKVWTERFSKKTRKNVRKAERLVQAECDTTGRLVPVFYDLLSRSFDQWAEQQNEPKMLARWRGQRRDPLEKFETIARLMKDSCRVWVAWLDGQPVAASMVLQDHNVNDSRGAIDRALIGGTNANDLIQMLSIQDACNAGCRYYHLGESGNAAGLHHFKGRFGAEVYPYDEYYLEKLPITRVDRLARTAVKKAIGFKDQPAGSLSRPGRDRRA